MLKPIRTTLFFALLCGIIMVPALVLLPQQYVLKVILTIYLGAYALLLCRWSETRVSIVIYPLLVVAGAALYPSTMLAFLLIGLAVLSWIRSGICYPDKPIRAFGAEVIVVTGGIISVLIWPPVSPLAVGMGCWLFFLVQSLYFYGLAEPSTQFRDTILPDRFEQISREMERFMDHQDASLG